jgi:hypothetical protein
MVDPAFAIDIHHQGLKTEYGTGDDVTLSLGISLAPGGPTLPGIEGGVYDVLTRQMHVHVYDELAKYGNINMDRYQVGGSLGQKARGKSIRQNVLALQEVLLGMATGEVQQEDPARWEEIPHAPVTGYQTDTGVIPLF